MRSLTPDEQAWVDHLTRSILDAPDGRLALSILRKMVDRPVHVSDDGWVVIDAAILVTPEEAALLDRLGEVTQ